MVFENNKKNLSYCQIVKFCKFFFYKSKFFCFDSMFWWMISNFRNRLNEAKRIGWMRDGRTFFAFPSLFIYADPAILASGLAGHWFPNNIIFNHACYNYFPKYLLKAFLNPLIVPLPHSGLGLKCIPFSFIPYFGSYTLWILLFPLISLSILLSLPYYGFGNHKTMFQTGADSPFSELEGEASLIFCNKWILWKLCNDWVI